MREIDRDLSLVTQTVIDTQNHPAIQYYLSGLSVLLRRAMLKPEEKFRKVNWNGVELLVTKTPQPKQGKDAA